MYKSEHDILFNYIEKLNADKKLAPLMEPTSYWVHGSGNPLNTLPFEEFLAKIIGAEINPRYSDKNFFFNKKNGDMTLHLGDYAFDIDVKVSENIKQVGSIGPDSLKMFRGWYWLFTDDRRRFIFVSAYDLYLHVLKTHEEFLESGIGDYNLNKLLLSSKIRYKEFEINR